MDHNSQIQAAVNDLNPRVVQISVQQLEKIEVNVQRLQNTFEMNQLRVGSGRVLGPKL
jgi:hypothetical protein